MVMGLFFRTISFVAILAWPLIAFAENEEVVASEIASAEGPEAGADTPDTGKKKETLHAYSPNRRGSTGFYRLSEAFPRELDNLSVQLAVEAYQASGLLTPTDSHSYSGQRLVINWSALQHLELFLSQTVVMHKNDAFDPSAVQSLGDPSLGFKSGMIFGSFALGLEVEATIPTSPNGSGLKAEAYKLSSAVLVSGKLSPSVRMAASVGYLLDNTSKIFSPDRILTPLQRYAAGISDYNLVTWGLGLQSFFSAFRDNDFALFMEFTGGVATEVKEFSENPMLATLGVKWAPLGSDQMAFMLASDIRIMGEPVAQPTLVGLPPWQVYFGVNVPFTLLDEPELVANMCGGAPKCKNDSHCSGGATCLEGICTLTKEVIKETVKLEEKGFFVVEGKVIDVDTKKPIATATISLGGQKSSPMAVDYNTGKFRSWPLEGGDGLVQVVASSPDYSSAEMTVPKGKNGDVVKINFKLSLSTKAAFGELRGSLKDGRSGKPLKGVVLIPSLKNKRIKVGKDGKFSAKIKTGVYQLLISSKGFVTQKKKIKIRKGDRVILNLDLRAKGGRR